MIKYSDLKQIIILLKNKQKIQETVYHNNNEYSTFISK